MNYVARACEYGNVRYERSNYMRPVAGAYDGTPKPKDFERLRSYLRALVSHATAALDALELHQSQDYHLSDVEGMKKAAFAEDTDEPPQDSKVGASHLPHLAHAGASLMMALVQATLCGLLPEDPGKTWNMRPAITKVDIKTQTNPTLRGYGLDVKIQTDPTLRGYGRPLNYDETPLPITPPCPVLRDGVRCKRVEHCGEHDFGPRCPCLSRGGQHAGEQCYLRSSHPGDCFFGNPL